MESPREHPSVSGAWLAVRIPQDLVFPLLLLPPLPFLLLLRQDQTSLHSPGYSRTLYVSGSQHVCLDLFGGLNNPFTGVV